MRNPTPTTTSLPRPTRRGWLLIALVLLAASTAAGVWWWRSRPEPPADPPIESDDPRLAFPTRFRNVRPDVQYVGDAACAECHGGRGKTYHQHPMGRSLGPAPGPQAAERLGADGRAAFKAFGFDYAVERRGDHLFQRETVPGPPGEPQESVEAKVGFVLGSGRRGAGYLMADDDGYVFQSPISWYPQKGAWGLSPSNRQGREHFDRPVSAECLFCHCNRVEPVENTINRYRSPLFRGEAIGCERCHGPGELHVQRQHEKRTEPGECDDTIVNPSRLEPVLREAVCEQCHLQGQIRVLRRGRGVFDYRPGLPLHLFWTVFEKPPGAADDTRAVGQVEQMHLSRCFRASKGELGCSSCHDAHKLPAADDKVEYYRNKCLDCHNEKAPCSLPSEGRLARSNDCAACHMPRLKVTDVAHVAVTDHRILRDPAHEPPRPWTGARGQEPPLSHFHTALVPAGEKVKWVERDLGVALMEMARQAEPGLGRFNVGQAAMPALREALRADPDDLAAGEALGFAWRCREQPLDSLEACEAVLARAPERERALVDAATMAGHLKRPADAVGYWRRAIAVSPRRWQYHYQLAVQLVVQHRPADALPECETALRLNPADTPTRRLQVGCLVELDRKDEARAAFARLMALKPADEDELRRWFDGLVR